MDTVHSMGKSRSGLAVKRAKFNPIRRYFQLLAGGNKEITGDYQAMERYLRSLMRKNRTGYDTTVRPIASKLTKGTGKYSYSFVDRTGKTRTVVATPELANEIAKVNIAQGITVGLPITAAALAVAANAKSAECGSTHNRRNGMNKTAAEHIRRIIKRAASRPIVVYSDHSGGNVVSEVAGSTITPAVLSRMGKPGKALAILATLGGIGTSMATPTRSVLAQAHHDRSDRAFKNLVPGVGIYNLTKRLGSKFDDMNRIKYNV